jgi:hypothetical protein
MRTTSNLICPRGHRRPFRGTRCVAKIGPPSGPFHECNERLIAEPEIAWCWCDRGIYVDGWCSFCGRPDTRETAVREPDTGFAKRGPTTPVDTGFPVGYIADSSRRSGCRKARLTAADPAERKIALAARHEASSAGGRPPLSTDEQRTSRARRRERDRVRKNGERNQRSAT